MPCGAGDFRRSRAVIFFCFISRLCMLHSLFLHWCFFLSFSMSMAIAGSGPPGFVYSLHVHAGLLTPFSLSLCVYLWRFLFAALAGSRICSIREVWNCSSSRFFPFLLAHPSLQCH